MVGSKIRRRSAACPATGKGEIWKDISGARDAVRATTVRRQNRRIGNVRGTHRVGFELVAPDGKRSDCGRSTTASRVLAPLPQRLRQTRG